ncbi:recombinase family protein [Rathayibacter sp. AY1H2]|uniref:recombinase family protein n=1 Tax=Rathayibacter sp. AY1H2 TaxID=2080566 RepID=UPI000CE7E731|nr:recombinase family protein [Rathayibacter sp. AY1H2]PPG85491.1 hypothetical protein C5C29_06040 [Rathayibacter sp. AY1H2]
MTRAAIYLRQSSDRDRTELGIDRQRARCTEEARRRGWTLVEEYVDNDVSATKPRAEGTAWHSMMKDARSRTVDAVIAVDMDRLLRTIRDLATLSETGLKVVTLDGEIDLTTADGEFRATMAAGLARFEGRRKAERQKRANDQRREAGTPTSGRVPYGYRWVTAKERVERGEPAAYELDAERAGDVRFIFDSFLAGVPLGSICRDLNAQGKRTLPSRSTPDGVPFRPTTVRRMLLSPYYAALLPLPKGDGKPYDQEAIMRADCVPGAWPAIVTPDEWAEAKTRLAHPERKTSPGPSRKWLLSGLALCGVCFEPIRAGGGEKGIHSYRCRSMAHFMRRGEPLDSFVERLVVARLSRPDASELLVDRGRGDLDELRAERRRLEASLDAVYDDWQDGIITTERKNRALKRANARIEEIDELTRTGANVDSLRAVVGAQDVQAAWDGLTLGHKRAVVETLLTLVVNSVGQGNRRQMSDEAMARTVEIRWHE